MEHTKRDQERLAVVFADLDRFKIVNDTMGHGTGDRLLVQVAQRLQQASVPAIGRPAEWG